MLPVYIIYLTGSTSGEDEKSNKLLKNAFGFVIGFSILFILLGGLSGTLGAFLQKYNTIVNIVSGVIIIVLGLSYINVIKIPFFNSSINIDYKGKGTGFFSSVLMGVVFSIGWTPCIGALLGFALTLAANSGGGIEGILLLTAYSLGMGLPFILSAILIDKVSKVFDVIKKHYKIINTISGILLIIIGVIMLIGKFDSLISFFTF